MNRETLIKELGGIVVEQLDVKPEEVVETANFANNLGADSLDIVEMIMAVDEKYNITTEDDVAETLLTFGDVIDYLEKATK
ncbi:MAG: acyl carrier protein [Patescibacteria group bacterium]|nr:acyl carrier protein [Patescibacteria group bacterium]